MSIRFTVLIVLILSPLMAMALDIPRGLNSAARGDITRILGVSSAPKMLTNPYPLGGYSGFEVGVSMEVINTREIQRLGTSSNSDQEELRYSRLTIGKGLYHDVDVFFHAVPPVSNVGISDYGASLRWAFFQAEFLPIHSSLWVYGNQINYQNSFMNQNVGGDLVLGLNVDNFAVYFGMGMVYAKGTFIGGNTGSATVPPNDPDLNKDTNVARMDVRSIHSVVGCTISFLDFFVSGQIDRYTDPVYSAKFGVRY